jgi:hypothetical protein
MNLSYSQDAKRSITFSLDACYTGFYLWFGSFCLRIGGVDVNESGSLYPYPYLVPTYFGFGFVLPNYFSWHTPFDKFTKIDITSQQTASDTSQSFRDIAT